MEAQNSPNFISMSEKVGLFNPKDRICLIPQMNRRGCHLLAGIFRGFGIKALVMGTYEGIDLGKEFTSGKECFPCQVTMGDILHYMKKEQERLGDAFNVENYVYFLPESEGPCRFGMYNKYQRIVLDSFPELEKLRICSLTSKDGYSLAGLMDPERVSSFRKSAYFSMVLGDILDRLLWRIRPYEKEPGMTDVFIERAMETMSDASETYGAANDFESILTKLEEVVKEGRAIMDPSIPPKPLIGIVGEIYLRTHVESNQDIIRVLERYGGEVVNASIAEWVNYVTYDQLRAAKIGLRMNLKKFRVKEVMAHLKEILNHGVNLYYQQTKLEQVYKRVKTLIDVPDEHRISHLEEILKEDDLFSFDVGTEACLSIAGILQYVNDGYNGVVNVYPFTCMPSTTTTAVVKPVVNRMKVPYLDAAYDGTTQPGREAAIRTFMYQAQQHLKRNGRKDLSEH